MKKKKSSQALERIRDSEYPLNAITILYDERLRLMKNMLKNQFQRFYHVFLRRLNVFSFTLQAFFFGEYF